MENRVYYNTLYDYYSSLLTDIQKKYFEDYYFNNLSLTEIADNYCVSKNAISKSIKETINKLDYYEECLHLNQNKDKITKILDSKEITKIEDYI